VIGRSACRLTVNHYRDFLLHELPKLPEGVPLAVRTSLWYMHNGAPAHLSRAVRDVLCNTYHDRLIGRGGPTASSLTRLEYSAFFTCRDT
jgi:hypothetical protein